MNGAFYWFNFGANPEIKERLIVDDYNNAKELFLLLEKGVPDKIRLEKCECECHMIVRWNDYDTDDLGIWDIVEMANILENKAMTEDFYIHFADNHKDKETEITFIIFIRGGA